jgi:peroxiredoxin
MEETKMVMTPSTMLPLGTHAPDFSLPDTSGKRVSRDDFKAAPALLVMFICNHCPFVQHIREELARFGRDYQEKGAAIVAINANDVEHYPDDSPAKMAKEAKKFGYTFPYLYDETQEIAKAYRAACTPDFYLFDGDRRLVYRGEPAQQRLGGDGCGSEKGDGCRPGRETRLPGSGPEHRLQHQMEGGERAGLLPGLSRPAGLPSGRGR